MALETTTVLLGKNKVPVQCIRSTPGKDRPTVIFEHSWNIPPSPDYVELLSVLDERVAVHALVKNGLFNFPEQPATLAGYGQMTVDYIGQLPEKDRAEVHLVGHSMGFMTGYEAARILGPPARSLIGLSPLLPGVHTLARFLGRFVTMTAGMLAGKAGPAGRRYVMRSAVRYGGRALRNLPDAVPMIREMARTAFATEPLSTQTCIIRGATDELIPYHPQTAAELQRAFSNLSQRVLSDPRDRHSFPVVFGARAAGEVLWQYEKWGLL